MRKVLTFGSRRRSAAGVVAAFALGAVACGSDDVADTTAETGGGSVEVVVTTSILGDVVVSALGELVDDAVTVEVVLPLGADPHDFEPSARQAEAMEGADLLVVNGLGLEAGLTGVIDAVADAGTPVFTFTDHIELIDLADEEHEDEEHGDEDHADEELEGEDHADDHDGEDPHFWMDPLRLAVAVDALAAELAALGVDPGALESSIEAYVADLDGLVAELDALLAGVPGERRALVTNHDSLGYFADRFDFEVLGAVIPSLTTSAESSASALEDLAALVAERELPAIFAETTESDRLAQALADEVGDDVAVVELYSGSLGEPGSGADTYRGYMITNAERIAAALG